MNRMSFHEIETETEIQSRDLSTIRLALDPTHRQPRQIVGLIPAAAFQELGRLGTVLEPVYVALTLTWEHGDYRMTGALEGAIQLECSRCLDPFRSPLSSTSINRFFAPGKEPPNENTMENEVDYLPDGFISVLRMVEEELLLCLPMIPLCREECAGLCQHCGAERNKEPCQCPPEEVEHPFAPLQRLDKKFFP